MTNLRIGHGYDVHRLTERRRLVLGGVEIPWDRGLLGHSDADVLTHAVMDALCGAAKLGDIGKLFPDSDPRYAGISSLELLRQVAALLQERGWAVVNIDATLIAQAPKVGPYRPEMEANLSAALGTDADRVNVKATTAVSYTQLGEPLHPEVMGVASWCRQPLVFDGPEAVEAWLDGDEKSREIPVTVVAQTTCIRKLFETSWKIIKKQCTNVQILSLIHI